MQLALDEGGDRQDQHDSQHDRQIQHKAGIDAEQRGALRDGEGCQRDRHAADQHKVKDVRADDVAQRQVAVALGQRGDSRDQLGQRGAECDKRQGDDALGHAEGLRDQGAVVHEQVCADGDQHRAQHKQDQRPGEGHFLLLGRLLRTGGGVFHLQHVDDHVRREHGQHDDAHDAGEFAEHIGRNAVDGRRREEEGDGGFQRFGVYLAGAHRNRDGRDQRRVADDRADGVAVGDLAMAGQRGHRGDHDLRQRCADGDHRRADEQLRQVEAAGQCGRAVNKPVAALDQEQQADNKKQHRDEHIDSSVKKIRYAPEFLLYHGSTGGVKRGGV